MSIGEMSIEEIERSVTGDKVVLENGVKYATGAVRSADAEKTRYDLISPIGLRRLAEAYAEGAAKYGDHNYERGMPISDLLNHAIRHLYLYLRGDRSEDHLAHACWGVMSSMHSEELWPHLNQELRRGECIPPNVTDEESEAWNKPREK